MTFFCTTCYPDFKTKGLLALLAHLLEEHGVVCPATLKAAGIQSRN